jgi:hypothetical protein
MSQNEIDHAIRTTFRNPPILASEHRAQYEHASASDIGHICDATCAGQRYECGWPKSMSGTLY